MIRLIIVALLLLATQRSAHAQYGPPIYAGGGFGYGKYPYLFPPACSSPSGHPGFGPDIWLGVRLRDFRVVARGAVVAEMHVSENACPTDSPTTGTFVIRNFQSTDHSATSYDLRGLYFKSLEQWNVAGGVFAGRMVERESNYYGATIMLGRGSVGIAADYARRNVKYEDVQWDYTGGQSLRTVVGSGQKNVGSLFLKAYVQMMRQ